MKILGNHKKHKLILEFNNYRLNIFQFIIITREVEVLFLMLTVFNKNAS